MDFTARGTLGWRYAFGAMDSKTTVAFSSGSPFAVAGLPIARNAAVAEVGFDAHIAPGMKLGIVYNGQIADKVQDHGLKGNFTWQF